MSDIERRMNRQQRVDRAYKLVVASGALGVIGAAGLVLAIVGIMGAGWPILSLIVAAILFMAFRRTLR
jgi:amino acid transporter